MRLNRRRTLLGLLGATSIAGLGAFELGDRAVPVERTLSNRAVADLLAIADLVFPAESGTFEPAVTGYVSRLSEARRRALLRDLSELNRVAYGQTGSPVRALSREELGRLFEALGVNRVEPDSQGVLAERVRFRLVNSLLYALLTHPSGTRQFGIENPVGYPGGFASYTRES